MADMETHMSGGGDPTGPEAAHAGTPAHAGGPAHAQPRYMLIWGVLFVLTAVEVGVAYLGLGKRLLVVTLVFLALC